MIAVFFKDNNEITKAYVMSDKVDFFLRLGAYRSEEEAEKPVALKIVHPGDKGHGRLGSYEWDEQEIKMMRTKKTVLVYTESIIMEHLPVNGMDTLSMLKKKALKLLKEYRDGNSTVNNN